MAEKKAKRGLNSLKILQNKAAALYMPVGTIGRLFMAIEPMRSSWRPDLAAETTGNSIESPFG